MNKEGRTLPRVEFGLEGRVALITGSGRGIGRETALRLAGHGAKVAVLARTEEQLLTLEEEIEVGGGTCLPLVCDVTILEQIEEALSRVAAELGGLHILINNAGGARWIRGAEKLSPEDFADGVRLNLMAVHQTMRAAAPLLFDHPGEASVVNVTSVAAAAGLKDMCYYSAAKSGVFGLTRAVAREWGTRGVRVNCLGPGWTETELSHGLRHNDEFFSKTLERIALERWASPEEIADGIVFLASDIARYVTGTTLYVDGGYLA
jgi:Dehydrogenases with different specificities (related to short-chain alcohol dehydrogenases)